MRETRETLLSWKSEAIDLQCGAEGRNELTPIQHSAINQARRVEILANELIGRTPERAEPGEGEERRKLPSGSLCLDRVYVSDFPVGPVYTWCTRWKNHDGGCDTRMVHDRRAGDTEGDDERDEVVDFTRLEADDLRAQLYEIADVLWPGDREHADHPPKPREIVKEVRARLSPQSGDAEGVLFTDELMWRQGAEAVLDDSHHGPVPSIEELAQWMLKLLEDKNRARLRTPQSQGEA